jgi:hypothetical protein
MLQNLDRLSPHGQMLLSKRVRPILNRDSSAVYTADSVSGHEQRLPLIPDIIALYRVRIPIGRI